MIDYVPTWHLANESFMPGKSRLLSSGTCSSIHPRLR